MSLTSVLTNNGIALAGSVIEIARQQGLKLSHACAMLEMETNGGRNIWGHDEVNTGGYYVNGGVVTQHDYAAWKPHRLALGSQGVGPCQLTDPVLQDQADAIGGAWSPIPNLIIGFRFLQQLISAHGIQVGFAAYNGSTEYGIRAVATVAAWNRRLDDDVEWSDKVVPDYYNPKNPDMPGSVGIGWAAAHAGQAVDVGRQCLDAIAQLRKDLVSAGVLKS